MRDLLDAVERHPVSAAWLIAAAYALLIVNYGLPS